MVNFVFEAHKIDTVMHVAINNDIITWYDTKTHSYDATIM